MPSAKKSIKHNETPKNPVMEQIEIKTTNCPLILKNDLKLDPKDPFGPICFWVQFIGKEGNENKKIGARDPKDPKDPFGPFSLAHAWTQKTHPPFRGWVWGQWVQTDQKEK